MLLYRQAVYYEQRTVMLKGRSAGNVGILCDFGIHGAALSQARRGDAFHLCHQDVIGDPP